MSGPLDFAWDTDFARFLCVYYIHVPILKPQSVWSDLFIFQSFTEIKFYSKACSDTFQDVNLRQLWRRIYKKIRNSAKKKRKTNTTAMYINSILSIEATFMSITFQSSKQEDLNDTLSVRLSHTRQNRSNSR